MEKEKSGFTRYREGYIAGYHGHEIDRPFDDDYLRGYATGMEDDIMGKSNRYPEDE